METMEKKVYFFRAVCREEGNNRDLPFDAPGVLDRIEAITDFSPSGRYWRAGDGNDICMWRDEYIRNGFLRLWPARISKIRRWGLPEQEIEGDGEVDRLQIASGAGLVETTFIVFFPNNIVGVIYHHYSPRISKAAGYISIKVGDLGYALNFDPILNADALNRLGSYREITTLRLRIRYSEEALAEESRQDIFSAARAGMRASGADVVDLVLKPRSARSGHLARNIFSQIQSLLRTEGRREYIERCQVRARPDGESGTEPLDLLHEQFIRSRHVRLSLNETTRALDKTSAYDAIINIWEELRGELESAAALEQV